MLCGLLAAPTMSAAAEPVAIAVPGLSSAGEAIARGADDAMWIAEPADPGAIARVTTAGVVTEFKGGMTHNLSANSDPSGLVASGGALWFALSGGEDLGRITTAGNVTRFGLEGDRRATSLAGGPDGRLWMTVEGDPGDPDAVARINGGNTATPFTSGLSSSSNPRSLIAGADGALWFVESGGSGRIGRVTTTGVITWTDVGGAPSALAAGPLDSLWYARGASVFAARGSHAVQRGLRARRARDRARRRALGHAARGRGCGSSPTDDARAPHGSAVRRAGTWASPPARTATCG